MPSTASKPPSGAASTRVTRTPSRCGTGPVAASATPAGAAGGPTTTTSSPPPSSDRAPRASVDDHTAGDFAGFHRAERVVEVVELDAAGHQRVEIELPGAVQAHHLGEVAARVGRAVDAAAHRLGVDHERHRADLHHVVETAAPTTVTVPARRAMSNACRIVADVPTTSSA